MGSMDKLTYEQANRLLDYDPETGLFTWRAGRRRTAGARAGCVTHHGYRRVTIDGSVYYEQRLAVLLMTGAWPEGAVDHINRDKGDNRWVNLRDVSLSANQHNREHRRPRLTAHGKWSASIHVDGKQLYIGTYATEQEAAAAYAEVKGLVHAC